VTSELANPPVMRGSASKESNSRSGIVGLVDTSQLTFSAVVPVFRGGETLRHLVVKLLEFGEFRVGKAHIVLREILLVDDGSSDHSSKVMIELAASYPEVRNVWLSRNFGQHPATLAGISSSTSDWVVTLDEDGQFAPESIQDLFTTALSGGHQLVYGHASSASQGVLRNIGSRFTKEIFASWLTRGEVEKFSSFRLINGFVARAVTAYIGSNTYLDVAFSWVVQSIGHCDVPVNVSLGRPSTYTGPRLFEHWVRLFTSSGTRPLRLLTIVGFLASSFGFIGGIAVLVGRFSDRFAVEGWASLAVLIMFMGGLILFSLGVLAEYIGVLVRFALGRPTYLVVDEKLGSQPNHN
jgi:glycosyltransferase involved in cell wall biosynthesis